MRTVLVTGAGRGLGWEFARQYAVQGWRVLAACRDPGAFEADPIQGARAVALDVADPDSIRSLARDLADMPLDLLINNAGQFGPRAQGMGEVAPEDWVEVMKVNALGPHLVTEALADGLKAAAAKVKTAKVVHVSSIMGSIADNTSGGNYIYRPSKAALNAVMRSHAHDLAPFGIVVVAVHPGWVRTAMGGPSATLSREQSVAALRHLIDGLTPAHAGRFYAQDGRELPW